MKSLKLFFMIMLILQQSTIFSSQPGIGQQFKNWLWLKWKNLVQYQKPEEKSEEQIKKKSIKSSDPWKSLVISREPYLKAAYKINIPSPKMQEYIHTIEEEIHSIKLQIQTQKDLLMKKYKELNLPVPEEVGLGEVVNANQRPRNQEMQSISNEQNKLIKKKDAFEAAVKAMNDKQ